MVPDNPALEGWPWSPGQSPFFSGASPWVYMFSRGCRAVVGGSAWRGGGGGCQCAVPPGACLGGPAGRGTGRSLCRGSFPRLLRAGTKAGRFVCAPRSMLHYLVSPAHGAPLCAGAELPVGSRHCGSGWVADWGHSGRGCARRGCGVPPLGAAASSGGLQGRRLPGRPLVVGRPESWEGG